MLPIKPTLIAAFTFAFIVHAQLCLQCPTTDNLGQGLAGNTPLIPGADICCVYGGTTCCYDVGCSFSSSCDSNSILFRQQRISYLTAAVSAYNFFPFIVRASSLDNDVSGA
ncbi:hypothetical protein DFH09DRAFT_1218860 [Mycena vulgaris]|nr:hypothetical protein DFH09DRAFT_1218860 [Mycena vulgaris]